MISVCLCKNNYYAMRKVRVPLLKKSCFLWRNASDWKGMHFFSRNAALFKWRCLLKKTSLVDWMYIFKRKMHCLKVDYMFSRNLKVYHFLWRNTASVWRIPCILKRHSTTYGLLPSRTCSAFWLEYVFVLFESTVRMCVFTIRIQEEYQTIKNARLLGG